MLWLAIAARNSGCRPSRIASIDDPIIALDFDLAHALRLNFYDAECRKEQARLIAGEVGKLFAGEDGSSGGSGATSRVREEDIL